MLNPAQQEVLDLLGAGANERPQFDAGLRTELRADLEAELAPMAEALDADETLWVSKHSLSQVHGCEGKYLADEKDQFAWSPQLARGTITHKAVELAVNWQGEPDPGELVDEAIASLTQGTKGIGDWLSTRRPAELAEVRATANDHVAKFLECFPPLKRSWTPVTETTMRVELCEQRIILSGRVDLSLGKANGTTAGKVLIDLKTGGFSPSHFDDMRFYALLDTIRIGTPPRLLASYYLDKGQPQVEHVSEGLLEAAMMRTIDGVRRMIELPTDDAPVLRPGAPCRWCSILDECAEGKAFTEEE